MNIDLPVHDFTRLLFLIAEEHGEISVEEAMASGLLQEYINRFKAGEIELTDDMVFEDEDEFGTFPSEAEDEDGLGF